MAGVLVTRWPDRADYPGPIINARPVRRWRARGFDDHRREASAHYTSCLSHLLACRAKADAVSFESRHLDQLEGDSGIKSRRKGSERATGPRTATARTVSDRNTVTG
jgi:hypothetical protein